jgi:hypothetical protein
VHWTQPQFAGCPHEARGRPPFGPEPDRAIGDGAENASKHYPPQLLPSAVNPAVLCRSTPSPSPAPVSVPPDFDIFGDRLHAQIVDTLGRRKVEIRPGTDQFLRSLVSDLGKLDRMV